MNEPTPDISGPHGRAWKFDMAAVERKTGKAHASIVSWCVWAPWAHMAWHSYAIHLIHLRPVPGVGPPTIHLADATHEIMVFALDPDWKMDLTEVPHFLTPVNFVGQFIEASDESAAKRIEQCVIDIVNGNLSPDTDYTQHWIARFGASNIKGDPSRAGETVIRMTKPDGSVDQIVYDPAPLNKRPKP